MRKRKNFRKRTSILGDVFQRKAIALNFIFSHQQKFVDQLSRRERPVSLRLRGWLDVVSM